MQPYFAVPIEGIEHKSFEYFRVTLDVGFITFFEDWRDLTDLTSTSVTHPGLVLFGMLFLVSCQMILSIV